MDIRNIKGNARNSGPPVALKERGRVEGEEGGKGVRRNYRMASYIS